MNSSLHPVDCPSQSLADTAHREPSGPPRSSLMHAILATVGIMAFGVTCHANASTPPTNQIEEMTWTEVRDRVASGATTILIPIGGTEQNGPYMVLGKHNVRARALADAIAQRLGNALVAPVISYVPEGSINPPAAHMRFAGTISISDAAFESMLESTARSFKQHGFRDVVFLGDHGGYQKDEKVVEGRLNREWLHDPSCRVHAVLEYYQITETSFPEALRKRGFADTEIGTHAGLADTSLSMAVDSSLVRTEALEHAGKPGPADGVFGDPRKASPELGEIGVKQIVDGTTAAVERQLRAPR